MSKNLYHSRPDIQWPIWYKRVIEFDSDNLMDIPEGSELLSNNGISLVWRGNDGWIYKQSIPFLTANEYGFYSDSYPGLHFFLPKCIYETRKYTVIIQDLGKSEYFTDIEMMRRFQDDIITVLSDNGIRHGDLTPPNIIIKNNHPFILDWAEARIKGDTRPTKREPETKLDFDYDASMISVDSFWLQKTFEELCEKN